MKAIHIFLSGGSWRMRYNQKSYAPLAHDDLLKTVRWVLERNLKEGRPHG